MPSHVLFLDESGDHTTLFQGRNAPSPPEIFLLCGCLFRADSLSELASTVEEVKRRHIGRTDVVLLSRQIRKREGPLVILQDPARREAFLETINRLISSTPVTVFASGIDKYRHWERYGDRALSPYSLSLAFIMERVTTRLSKDEGTVQVVAESRGRREDAELRLEYDRLLRQGTAYTAGERIRAVFLAVPEFRRKWENLAGLQIADLVAYPLAQRLRYPDSRSPALDIVLGKLHHSRRGIWGAGLKVFPPARAADFGL